MTGQAPPADRLARLRVLLALHPTGEDELVDDLRHLLTVLDAAEALAAAVEVYGPNDVLIPPSIHEATRAFRAAMEAT